MKPSSLLWLSLASAIFLSGCASTRPTVGAWHDSHFTLTRTDKLALTLRADPTDEDARLGDILTAELKSEGFNLVPLAEADYVLVYLIENNPEEGEVPGTLSYMQAPSQTTGQIANPIPQPFQTLPQTTGQIVNSIPQPFQTPSTTVVFDNKEIRLYLYTNPKTHPGRLQLAWTGSINAGGTVSTGHEPLLIEALLRYFGQNYAGPVNLAK